MSDMLYKVEHEVKTLRAQLKEAEGALMDYVRGDGSDLDVYERLNANIERLFGQLESAEELERDLRGEDRACMYG